MMDHHFIKFIGYFIHLEQPDYNVHSIARYYFIVVMLLYHPFHRQYQHYHLGVLQVVYLSYFVLFHNLVNFNLSKFALFQDLVIFFFYSNIFFF